MPRRQRLSDVQRSALVGVPTDPESLARYFNLDVRALSLVRTKRGAHNRLGYAVQLAYLHFPGQALAAEAAPPGVPLISVPKVPVICSRKHGRNCRVHR